jgi:predicted ATP-grasp superfamily ATP-dependent carboligase
MRTWLAGCVAIQLAACSPISLDAAKKLAATGADTANAAGDFVGVPQNKMGNYLEGLHLVAAIPPPAPAGGARGCNPYALTAPSMAMTKDAEKAAELYGLQVAMFRELAATYQAFGDLASYDASGQVESGLKDLTAAGNNYIKAVNPGAPGIPSVVSGIITGVGGFIAEEAQKKKVHAASVLIRERLERIAPAFRAHTDLYSSIREEQIGRSYEVAVALWCIGVADASAISRSFLEDSGLTVRAGGGNPSSQYKAAYDQGVENVLKSRSDRALRVIEVAYSEAMQSLDELIKEHEKLEAGAPITAEQLSERIKRIRTLLEAVTPKK